MAGVADDDVIEHGDLEDRSGSHEIAGDPDVRLRRAGISAGVIVDQDDAVRRGDDRRAEHFPSVNQQAVQCAG